MLMNERIVNGRINIVRNGISDSIIQKWKKELTVGFIEDYGERQYGNAFSRLITELIDPMLLLISWCTVILST